MSNMSVYSEKGEGKIESISLQKGGREKEIEFRCTPVGAGRPNALIQKAAENREVTI